MINGAPPPRSLVIHPPLEGPHEREQCGATSCTEPEESVPREPALAVMSGNRRRDRRRASIVQQRGPRPDTPQRSRAHLAARCPTLHDAVTQTAHVVQQEIGKRPEYLPRQRRDRTGTCDQRRRVAAGATDAEEDQASRERWQRNRRACRR